MIRNLLAALVCTALLACSALGLTKPATFNEQADTGITTCSTVLKSVDTLVVSGKITAADAKNIEAQVDNVMAGIGIARQIYATDQTTGGNKLASVLAGLQALETYLTTQGAPK
jgi:glycerol uptake facilitator-like aquaporin